MTTAAELDAERLETLRTTCSGPLITPADAGYEEARRVHNGLIDRRPALIVRCQNPADIAAALTFAADEGLELSVRGGGHNVAGRAVLDGGVMIDLSSMKYLTVDPEAMTVRAQGGVLWAELNAAAAEHGLATTGGAISTTGIAGLTLGGGLGWLMAKYGLAADNLLAVELVTADGEIVDVNAESRPDLFWALRGGGGNFGVAASLTYRLHALEMITGGLIAHPLDAGPEMLRFYRDACADASDDLTVFAALTHAPDGSGVPLAAMIVCHTGTPAEAERDLAPYKEWGSPLVVDVGPMPYPVMNTLIDEGFPTGSLNYWLSSFASGLTDGLIDTVVSRFATAPSPMTNVVLEHFHGAVTRVGPADTAVPHREKGWNLALTGVWMDPADSETNIAWTRETHAALKEHLTERRWLNYLADDQGDDAIRGAYGPNYDRLVEVKRRYDPRNVFHQNHNIVP
jgi:FAD/FMN-containing dehydrogenase